jgi:hypothetical protein
MIVALLGEPVSYTMHVLAAHVGKTLTVAT